VRSWSAVRALRIDRIEVRPDNSVLGMIAIQQPDGSWLRVEQVLRRVRMALLPRPDRVDHPQAAAADFSAEPVVARFPRRMSHKSPRTGPRL